MYNSEAPAGFFDRSHDARKSSKAKGRKKRDFTPLRFLMGESGIAALYNVKDESSGSECTPTLKSLNQALKQSIVSARLCEANVLKVLHGWQGCGPHVSLCALATVARLFNALPGATIPLEVAIKPLHEGKWTPRGYQKGGYQAIGHNYLDLNLEEEFACISPPRMREPGHDSWTQISHHPFDGKLENNFQHTTLHLTFSDYELPIDVGQHGLRDRQIYFLEAPVSVHDHGEWVGDLDVLKALNSENLRRRPICTGHDSSERADESLLSRAVSLDNWEELLGSPADTAVVRTHGHWQARLAAMVLSIQ
ncbi:hypothetical protein F5882DRAFT_471677 [Hyaloscypha sp. PMI_1271]|nr:hypothetical protein F5882DRAFT_471677 [Hyaloscypha sp. PMI_1271]